jgi:sugar transferase (PEP-CTERM system associated)
MIRVFHVYYPMRTVILLGGEALVICSSFILATVLAFKQDSFLILNFEYGYLKILGVTCLTLLCSHWLDLYNPARWRAKGELYLRLMLLIGCLSLVLAALEYLFPSFNMGQETFVLAVAILTVALFGWRKLYVWIARAPYLRERVYLLGSGPDAEDLLERLRTQLELGVEVVGWSGSLNGNLTRAALAEHLVDTCTRCGVHRVIVALTDRRGTIPVRELLEMRVSGVRVEDCTSWLERVSGKVHLDNLYPSWMIFSDGFRLHTGLLAVRRLLSIAASLALLMVTLPVLPLVALLIKFTSPGPIFYHQSRVGKGGERFYCYKFRTMRADAEADIGPTWASDEDPRITPVGRYLRKFRLDEIPQLYNVLRGDMGFVGPRPERPEFVESLSREVPYYPLRHTIRPGITGWAQVNYPYGNSVEDAVKKLEYDLFYIKNMSIGLDLLTMFQTVKIVLLGRGAH